MTDTPRLYCPRCNRDCPRNEFRVVMPAVKLAMRDHPRFVTVYYHRPCRGECAMLRQVRSRVTERAEAG